LEFGHRIVQVADQFTVLFRDRPTDRVRNIDGGGAGRDDGPANLDQEIGFGARTVLGRELDVVDVALGLLHAFDGQAHDLVARLTELEFTMDL
jgi:hypothetical protein